MGLYAEWALIIPIFHKGNRSVMCAADVIPRPNWEDEVWREATNHDDLLEVQRSRPAAAGRNDCGAALSGLPCAAMRIDDELLRRAVMEGFVGLRRLLE